MANTTDVMIACCDEDDVVEWIAEQTKLPFKKTTDGTLAGGPKVLIFEAYGVCVRCIPQESIDNLVKVFQSAPFNFPEVAVLIISDDSLNLNKVFTRNAI